MEGNMWLLSRLWEGIHWFFADTVTLICLPISLGLLILTWPVAWLISTSFTLGAHGVFSEEIRGYRAWSIAFLVHGLILLALAASFRLTARASWLLLAPYIIWFFVDLGLCAFHRARATRLYESSRPLRTATERKGN